MECQQGLPQALSEVLLRAVMELSETQQETVGRPGGSPELAAVGLTHPEGSGIRDLE